MGTADSNSPERWCSFWSHRGYSCSSKSRSLRAGFSACRAWRMLVFPDSFFPTRQVILGSASIVPESRMFLKRTVRNEMRFTVAPRPLPPASGRRVDAADAVRSPSGQATATLSEVLPGLPFRSVPHRGLYRHFRVGAEGRDLAAWGPVRPARALPSGRRRAGRGADGPMMPLAWGFSGCPRAPASGRHTYPPRVNDTFVVRHAAPPVLCPPLVSPTWGRVAFTTSGYK